MSDRIAGQVRLGKILQKILRNRIPPVGRDDVTGEWLAAEAAVRCLRCSERIENLIEAAVLAESLRKIALALQIGRHRQELLAAGSLTEGFVCAKDKRPV